MTQNQQFDGALPQRVAIIGVGLLGGSVAKSIRRTIPGVHVSGYSRRESTRKLAVDLGVLDDAFDSVEEACASADFVVVATPVTRISEFVIQAAKVSPKDCVITDVGSTKAQIVREVAVSTADASKFVPAHPIAGSEKTGVDHAVETLFDGKVVIVTPLENANGQKVDRAYQFWSATGASVHSMSPEHHDECLAAVSHVPHLMSSLVAKIAPQGSLGFVGSGWKDITRVAAGDPEMWTAICQHNRGPIIDGLEKLIAQASELKQTLVANEDQKLTAWLTEAKAVREVVD